jgi:DNA-binding phage protein
LVRLLFEEMNRQQTTIAEVTVRAGISPQMMRDWRNRSRPKLDAIDAALNVIGLRLTVEPMPDD